MTNQKKLRSAAWFDTPEYYGFSRKAWLRSEGLGSHIFHGKPVIGICNSWSELNNCNLHLRQVAEAVKRGVWVGGGVPLEFPTISLGEMFLRPTSMLLRNLMAMDVEESIRANPLDGVVLLCGCDKTTPAQLMGAISAGIPAILVPGGPMLGGLWRNQKLGAGTDGRRLFDQYRRGELGPREWSEIEGAIARSAGHCAVMGTASTMACVVEAMGMTLPGCAAIPAVDSRRYEIAERSGMRIVEMVKEDLTPSRILTRQAIENGVTAMMALGGSTNAVVHLLAIARRAGVALQLDDFDVISRRTPTLANVKPSGEYLMEDFFAAGGVPALLMRIRELLNGDCLTVNGKTLAQNLEAAACWNEEIIRPLDRPLSQQGAIAVLRGNLCPDGAVIKQSAASPALLRHRGPAYVFENYEHMREQIDSPDLPVDEKTVLVMKNCGPKGAPGFPEWGHIPIPKRLLERGVQDVVRISDARMSGTSFGTIVLHVAPESAVGGPLAAVRTGDEVTLDVESRLLQLEISNDELEARLAQFVPPPPHYQRGYGKLFLDHVTQAHLGCDFDFL
ncbi:MAG: dihydroxy-acid dehydratase [Bryobacteraceae bacterium]|nr:dihydroxy-acid dehydratase [Bryobacteraceae bacterium]MDW8379061.1 IlvD/Edd family dehydratase [Bryobacterales bacterium]